MAKVKGSLRALLEHSDVLMGGFLAFFFIHIFNAAGLRLGVFAIPEYATNFVFGDDDLCSLYVTATTSIYRLRVQVPGIHPNLQGSHV